MRRILRLTCLLVVAAVSAAVVTACGSDDKSSNSRDPKAEQAFMRAMIPHHESAVEMAKMAQEKGQHRQIRELASDIVTAQNRETAQMKRIYKRLFKSAIKPDESAHQRLGLSAKQAGMEHMDMAMLEKAKPFDRAFIDHMIPHHQGAIRMARAVMGKTQDAALMRLAEGIVGAQSSEIEEMNDWRKQWYRAASPAGGVPKDGEPSGGGGHEGH